MAKKKETSASPFVPVEEQPYKIPDNWCWVKVGTFLDIYRGVSYKKDDAHTVKSNNDCLIMRGGNVLEGAIDVSADNIYVDRKLVQEVQLIKKHDIVIVSSTGSSKVIGRAGIADTDYSDVAFGAFLMLARPNGKAVKPFVDLFFQSDLYRGRVQRLASGVNINNIRMGYITDAPIPIPPLPEQQRIVSRIESLFAKLDEAKEKAQVVVDGFELRKSAMLHKAFTGELTAKWREARGVGLDSWEVKRINEITKPRAGYAFDSKKFTNSGYQIIRMGNLYGGELDLSRNPVFISPNDVDETAAKRALVNNGDILITLTGTKYKRDYGYAVSIIKPVNLLVNQRILCLTPSQNIERNYILYYLRSNIFRDIFFSNETGGVNQGNVSSKFVENIEIKVPSFAEQHEIATILDRMMDKEQQVKEAAEAVLDQIDTMKKAILARAFRGELGTNDPTEESAAELVKGILCDE